MIKLRRENHVMYSIFDVPLRPIMKVAIVKYNAGNIYSVVHALRRLGVEPVLTDVAARTGAAHR